MQKGSTRYKVRPKKRFGQNFLIDNGIIESIIDAADIKETDTVLEIGPGRGALTKELVNRANRVVAVEIDWDLAALLREDFSEHENMEIVEGDVLKLNLHDYFDDLEKIKVVANLPYYITTPIIMKLFEERLSFERIIVMVQKEVALRMCANANTSDYGALSLAVQYYSYPSIICDVPATSFRPIPKVDSSVVMMLNKPEICDNNRRENLFRCVKAAFSQRRKTLVNALSGSGIASKEDIKEVLKSLSFDENIRGESLDLESFIAVSEKIGELNGH